MTAPIILWFRRDLRLADNPAVAAARASGAPVIPLYVLDESPSLRPSGAASKWWLEKSLRALAGDLGQAGSRLILRKGSAEQVLAELAGETNAASVIWNELFDPGYPQRDAALAKSLRAADVDVSTFNGAYLLHPDEVRTKTGGPFRVFTPFWRAARQQVEIGRPDPTPRTLEPPARWPRSDDLDDWRLHPTSPDWSAGFDWTPGEAGAHEALDRFIDHALRGYGEGRDRPGIVGSSRLSPHLHWGELGPRQVWRAVMAAAEDGEAPDSQADAFVRELGWREFCAGLLFHEGDLAQANYDERFDHFEWRRDARALRVWREGRTGYPIVDAGMRELWTTGWMHNRVRMIVASFLTKHLLIDWREGERWFWDCLVDADHANNAGNWQWVAGSGADASPYFRIFAPVTQGEKFDGAGDYVRRWLPELGELPDRWLHAPWTAPAMVLAAAGVRLGETYPEPMVDHGHARQRALEAYGRMRAKAGEPGAGSVEN